MIMFTIYYELCSEANLVVLSNFIRLDFMLLYPTSEEFCVITMVALFTFACHLFVFQCLIIQEQK